MTNKVISKCFKRVLHSNIQSSRLGSSSKSRSETDLSSQSKTVIEEEISIGPRMVDISSKLLKQDNLRSSPASLNLALRIATAEAIVCINDDLKRYLCSNNFIDFRSDSSFNLSTEDIHSLLSGLTQLITTKGDVFSISRLAGIQAAKQTPNLIPLCHQIPLSHISVDIKFDQGKLRIRSTVKTVGQATGVEMEALTAVSVAALTVYDMLKPFQNGAITIEKIELLEKHGGSRGSFCKKECES